MGSFVLTFRRRQHSVNCKLQKLASALCLADILTKVSEPKISWTPLFVTYQVAAHLGGVLPDLELMWHKSLSRNCTVLFVTVLQVVVRHVLGCEAASGAKLWRHVCVVVVVMPIARPPHCNACVHAYPTDRRRASRPLFSGGGTSFWFVVQITAFVHTPANHSECWKKSLYDFRWQHRPRKKKSFLGGGGQFWEQETEQKTAWMLTKLFLFCGLHGINGRHLRR